ncbi:MAG: histidine kinase dimerization/phosphoacceptor domain-containing protein, partial [Clostridia bacterium]|nr:histidine kinase dimerization/phosphoacceptor domain-containing protein [Clostridia bacterium]
MKDKPFHDSAYETPSVFRFWKLLIYLLLVFVESMIIATNWRLSYFGFPCWYVTLPVGFVIIIENAVKIWGARSFSAKIPCYVIDSVALIALTIFTDGNLLSTLYIVILSEFYLNQKGMGGNIAMGAASIVLFLIALAVSNALLGQSVNVALIITNAVNDLILMALHFLVFNFTVQIYRKNREIAQAFVELNVSNEKLRVAYEELQEVTALEERQRIAKDIHDTAGHSITTVIMQTEAAKLLIDTDPAEAKQRIAAANLQAKNALEELRESVHLLSGT